MEGGGSRGPPPKLCTRAPKIIATPLQRTDALNSLEVLNGSRLPNKDDIIQLLKEFSLQNLILFYNAICKHFDIQCSTVDCYRAAYLLQRRKYPEMLDLCERILNKPDLQCDLKEFAFANVIVLPPIHSFFDRDIQCLLGFHTLVRNLSPSNEDLEEIEDSEISAFQNIFDQVIDSYKCPFFLVPLQPYSMKCHYFIRRHVLARYLKVRCLIDCNHSLSEVMFEFKKLKACLPFEHTIHCFLEQKLGNFRKLLKQNTVQGRE